MSVINPPRNLSAVLGELPEVQFVEQNGAVTLCFVNSADELRLDMSRARAIASKTKFWILWCKRSSPSHNGVTDRLVRETGFAFGLVDYKVCSVDKNWSAMLFARKK